MKSTQVVLLTILVSVLSGCSIWNKYDIREVAVNAPPGNKSVAIAVVDERSDLKQGEIYPESIGVTRDGYGIPYLVKTATKNSVAQEIAQVVVQGFGSNRKIAPPLSFADTFSAKAALRGTGTDRQVLIVIERFSSDTLIRTELDYSFHLQVFDSNGRLLSTASRSKTDDLGGNFFLPALHARQSVLRTTGAVLTDLLSSPQVRTALE